MKPEALKFIIKEGEGLTVEFKEKYKSKIDRDIVALSNSKGGVILLGVSDDGKVVGEKLSNAMKAEIQSLARNCEPQINISKTTHIGNMVVIEILEGEEKPYSCSSGFFRRLDAVTQKMSQREVRTIFRDTEALSFEDLVCKDICLSDISLKKVTAFLKESKTSYQVNKSNLSSFLSSLNVSKKAKINNTGALMFASKVAQFVPYSEIILAAFKGKDKTYIYDRKDVRDDLLTQLKEAEMFLKKHLNIRTEIHGMNREDIYEIPLDALREALVNAIIHRDYRMRGTSIYLEIYDDRVVVVNPGGLPSGITKANFGQESVRRNLIIADLFHRMFQVERVGSGIEKMRNFMREAGLKKPVFEIDTFFRVIFSRDPQYSLKKSGQEVDGKGGQKKWVERVGRKGGQKIDLSKLGESQKRIIELMRGNVKISKKELSQQIGINPNAIDKNIEALKKKGLLKRIGPAKGGRWEVSGF